MKKITVTRFLALAIACGIGLSLYSYAYIQNTRFKKAWADDELAGDILSAECANNSNATEVAALGIDMKRIEQQANGAIEVNFSQADEREPVFVGRDNS